MTAPTRRANAGLARAARSVEAAAIAGLAHSGLALIATWLLLQAPEPGSGSVAIEEWYDDAGNQRTMILGLNLVVMSSIAFVWFVAVIRRRVGDRENRFFGTVFFGSSIAYVAVWLVGGAVLAGPATATAVLDSSSVSGDSASLSAGIGQGLLLVVAPRVLAVFMMTTSTLIFRSHVLPSWLAVVGFATAAAMFLVPWLAEPLGLAFPAWVLLVSIVLVRRRPAVKGASSRDEDDGEQGSDGRPRPQR